MVEQILTLGFGLKVWWVGWICMRSSVGLFEEALCLSIKMTVDVNWSSIGISMPNQGSASRSRALGHPSGFVLSIFKRISLQL